MRSNATNKGMDSAAAKEAMQYAVSQLCNNYLPETVGEYTYEGNVDPDSKLLGKFC